MNTYESLRDYRPFGHRLVAKRIVHCADRDRRFVRNRVQSMLLVRIEDGQLFGYAERDTYNRPSKTVKTRSRSRVTVSSATWWRGVRSGCYPKPVKLGRRITAWRVEDIRALVDGGLR